MKSAVAGIVERGGGLRLVIAPPHTLHLHVNKGEKLFVLPAVRVQEPVPLEDIPVLINQVKELIEAWRK